jgi:hypothetical protein
MTIEVARDWLDYVEAIGAGGSLLLAGIAAWFAWRSAGDSSRSAAAAELTAEAATEEATLSRQMVNRIEEQLEIERAERTEREQERSRRPSLMRPEVAFQATFSPDHLTVGLLMKMGVPTGMGDLTEPFPIVIKADFLNVGDKAADQMLARVVVPRSVELLPSGPAGDHPQTVDLHAVDGLALLAAGEPEPARQFSWRVAHMPPNQPETVFLTLVLRRQAEYEVEVAAEHPEAEPVRRRFIVSTEGVRPDLIKATAESP